MILSAMMVLWFTASMTPEPNAFICPTNPVYTQPCCIAKDLRASSHDGSQAFAIHGWWMYHLGPDHPCIPSCELSKIPNNDTPPLSIMAGFGGVPG
jgi:hypothetical protein